MTIRFPQSAHSGPNNHSIVWICVNLVVCGVITLVALVFLCSTSCCSASSQLPEGLCRVSKSMWLSTRIRPCSRSRRQFQIVHSRMGSTFSNCQGDGWSQWGSRYFYNHFINQILTVQCILDVSRSLVHNSDRMPIAHPHSSPGRGRYGLPFWVPVWIGLSILLSGFSSVILGSITCSMTALYWESIAPMWLLCVCLVSNRPCASGLYLCHIHYLLCRVSSFPSRPSASRLKQICDSCDVQASKSL